MNGERVLRVQDALAAAETDLVLVVQPHRSYNFDAILDAAPLVFDTCGKLAGPNIERL